MKKKDITQELKQQIINDYVVNYLSIKDLCLKYDIKSRSFISSILSGFTRNRSEAGKLRSITKPFKHNKETKEIMSKKRTQYLSSHKKETAWYRHAKGIMSKAEMEFEQILLDKGIDRRFNIVKELSIYPYFADFAFIDIMLVVEVDGDIHKQKSRSLSDKKKDAYLESLGWKVVRFSSDDIFYNKDLVINKLIELLQCYNIDNNIPIIGITKYKSPKRYEKVRGEDGHTKKQKRRLFAYEKSQAKTI